MNSSPLRPSFHPPFTLELKIYTDAPVAEAIVPAADPEISISGSRVNLLIAVSFRDGLVEQRAARWGPEPDAAAVGLPDLNL